MPMKIPSTPAFTTEMWVHWSEFSIRLKNRHAYLDTCTQCLPVFLFLYWLGPCVHTFSNAGPACHV
jgi:hypothetical protein